MGHGGQAIDSDGRRGSPRAAGTAGGALASAADSDSKSHHDVDEGAVAGSDASAASDVSASQTLSPPYDRLAKGGGGGGGQSARPASRHLAFAVNAMGGTWLSSPAPGALFAGAAFDSRRVGPGQLFFALPGAHVDGYEFCAAAAAAGAAALVVAASRGVPAVAGSGAGPAAGVGPGSPPIPVIGVGDPLAALADLARAVRAEFSGRVVGITGSNGKTTTRQLTAAALRSAGPVLATEGNYNTEIGLPITILSATGVEAFWVLEMAMRGRGQIALLADIARPHVGVITNVAGAHLELLGSIEEVARAKGELFAGLDAGGIAVLPGGDPLIEEQAAHLPASRTVRFDAGSSGSPPSSGTASSTASGKREAAEAVEGPMTQSAPAARGPGGGRADVVILESMPAGASGQIVRYAVRDQPVVARLPLTGAHNARNGAAALAVAAALGLPIPEAALALADTVLPPHRSFPTAVAGRIVLDDCYNANPASMRAAISAVALSAQGRGQRPGRAFAVLGDMLELGTDAREMHHAVGGQVAASLAGLVAVGSLGAEIARGARDAGMDPARVVTVDDPSAAGAHVPAWTAPGDWILVKASRGMRLERAVDALVEEFRKQPGMT